MDYDMPVEMKIPVVRKGTRARDHQPMGHLAI